MIDVLKSLIKQFMPFAQEKMGFSRPPRLFLRQDEQNAANPLGKTGFYDPEAESITLYTTGRHPKDIMRSLAHELMHHAQKCRGEFENMQNMGEEGYAQTNIHMRTMEIEAYQASIVFRDWEDSTKGTIYYEHLQKGDKSSMSTKDWKNGELKSLLAEAWGFKMDLSKLNEKDDKERLDENRQPRMQKKPPPSAEPGRKFGTPTETPEEKKEREAAERMKKGEGAAPDEPVQRRGQESRGNRPDKKDKKKPGMRDKKDKDLDEDRSYGVARGRDRGRQPSTEPGRGFGTPTETPEEKKKRLAREKMKASAGAGRGERPVRTPKAVTTGKGLARMKEASIDEMGCPSGDMGGEEMTVAMDDGGGGDIESLASQAMAAIQKLVDAAGGGMPTTVMTGDDQPMEEKRRRGRKRETNPDGDRPMEEAVLRDMVMKIVKETLQGN
jgi:hypothetical protein